MEQSHLAFGQANLIHDVRPAFRGCRRGQGNRGGRAQLFPDVGDSAVIWSEVVAPLADAVCLIDCEQLNVSARNCV